MHITLRRLDPVNIAACELAVADPVFEELLEHILENVARSDECSDSDGASE